jgi:hypothetical protein
MIMDLVVDYIRMVGYTIVILTSLKGIYIRKFNNILFTGDIIMAFSLLVSTFLVSLAGLGSTATRDLIMTPAVVLWAMVHFISLLKE